MPGSLQVQLALEEFWRDLDMLVYKLEHPASAEPLRAAVERLELRRELERLRDEMEELARTNAV